MSTASDADAFLARLTAFCATLPGSEAYVMVHHPAFRVKKKPFAIYGSSEYGSDSPTLSIKVAKELQPMILEADARFYKTHYIGQHGWISLRLTEPHSWEEIEGMVRQSYLGVAPAKKPAARC